LGLLFNLAILGIVAIGFLKVGGGDFLNLGFSSFGAINKQVKDVFQNEKTHRLRTRNTLTKQDTHTERDTQTH